MNWQVSSRKRRRRRRYWRSAFFPKRHDIERSRRDARCTLIVAKPYGSCVSVPADRLHVGGKPACVIDERRQIACIRRQAAVSLCKERFGFSIVGCDRLTQVEL